MGMRITGVIKAMNSCDRFEKELEQAAGDTAEESAKHVYKESQIEVPKKTHQLAQSGRFIIHSAAGPVRAWGVKYGRDVADSDDETVLDYAAAVHEILSASHAPPTKAKYVEDPLNQGLRHFKKSGKIAAKAAVRRAFR